MKGPALKNVGEEGKVGKFGVRVKGVGKGGRGERKRGKRLHESGKGKFGFQRIALKRFSFSNWKVLLGSG